MCLDGTLGKCKGCDIEAALSRDSRAIEIIMMGSVQVKIFHSWKGEVFFEEPQKSEFGERG